MQINRQELNDLNNKTIIIDGNYEGFIGTDLENDSLVISIQKKNRIDSIELSIKCQDEKGKMLAGVYSKESFKASIIKASGIYDEFDIELSDEDAKEYLWENPPKILEEAITKAINSFVIIENEKKSETEDLTANMQDGTQEVEPVV